MEKKPITVNGLKDLKSEFPKVVDELSALGKKFQEKMAQSKRPVGKI